MEKGERMIQETQNEDKNNIFFNQNLPWIVKEKKRISPTGTVIEQEYISIGGKSLKECKDILDKIEKAKE